MQKTATKAKSSRSYTKPALQKSKTLSRKYVRRPATRKTMDIKAPSKVKKTDSSKATVSSKKPKVAVKKASRKSISVKSAPKSMPKKVANNKAKSKNAAAVKKSSQSIVKLFTRPKSPAKVKTPAVSKAPAVAKSAADAKAAAADATRAAIQEVATMESTKPMKKRRKTRAIIALGLSTAVVTVLGIFVIINLPNISVKVVAMQTGIEATYPSFIPRGYSLETVASDKGGKITMKFVGPSDTSFTLVEENSTWDSSAVLNNYVRENFSASYSTMHEQGITYYSDPGAAAWVNGGIFYTIISHGKNLSREQIRNIVVSL
ncbi:hypothetical protein IKG48_00585 [Candidatus Saccharibacteria bacterium]|nr:hypothetical protein [Candidatus Saccharibacteria bacterium]